MQSWYQPKQAPKQETVVMHGDTTVTVSKPSVMSAVRSMLGRAPTLVAGEKPGSLRSVTSKSRTKSMIASGVSQQPSSSPDVPLVMASMEKPPTWIMYALIGGAIWAGWKLLK